MNVEEEKKHKCHAQVHFGPLKELRTEEVEAWHNNRSEYGLFDVYGRKTFYIQIFN